MSSPPTPSLIADTFTDHPEGGRFREVHRSPRSVRPAEGPERCACTHIYFHLRANERSRFHRVRQEEIWNLYEGALTLWIFGPDTDGLQRIDLSAASRTFCAVIPAGAWQAAEPVDGEALVGCTVAPGFEFEDFELITSGSPEADLPRKHGLARLL